MGELIDQGASIRSMFHPVVNLDRDGDGNRVKGVGEHSLKESMMLVFIERLPADRHDALLKGLDDSLNDLHLAVHDFPRMQKLLAQEIETLERLGAAGALRVDAGVLAEDLAFLRWVDANHFVFLGARGYAYPRSEDGNYARRGTAEPVAGRFRRVA